MNARPEEPLIPRLLYSDATPEALATGLAKGWPSGGVMSSEGGVVFGSHGMSSDSVMRTLAMQNELWDGGSIHYDRKTTESITVSNVRFSMFIQVQGATLTEFLNRSGDLFRGIGSFARFLV
jgi:putative DNA primase/helicase